MNNNAKLKLIKITKIFRRYRDWKIFYSADYGQKQILNKTPTAEMKFAKPQFL